MDSSPDPDGSRRRPQRQVDDRTQIRDVIEFHPDHGQRRPGVDVVGGKDTGQLVAEQLSDVVDFVLSWTFRRRPLTTA
jgi:hypothetical protein